MENNGEFKATNSVSQHKIRRKRGINAIQQEQNTNTVLPKRKCSVDPKEQIKQSATKNAVLEETQQLPTNKGTIKEPRQSEMQLRIGQFCRI